MRNFQKINVVVFHTYRYATFNCENIYFNTNFDAILKELGKFYFKRPDLGVNGVCSLIKDEINKEWHLNGLKKKVQLKRVSTNQIKTIRRSFHKLRDKDENFIRIPFNVVPIFFFILSLLKQIDNENSNVNKLIQSMNFNTIGEYIYDYHMQIFKTNYKKRVALLTDPALKNKYLTLEANLIGFHTIMNKYFRDIEWDKKESYIIK